MKIRKGDLILYINYEGHKEVERIGIVKGTEKDWYVVRNCVDGDNFICPFENIISLVCKREDLENWWNFI